MSFLGQYSARKDCTSLLLFSFSLGTSDVWPNTSSWEKSNLINAKMNSLHWKIYVLIIFKNTRYIHTYGRIEQHVLKKPATKIHCIFLTPKYSASRNRICFLFYCLTNIKLFLCLKTRSIIALFIAELYIMPFYKQESHKIDFNTARHLARMHEGGGNTINS